MIPIKELLSVPQAFWQASVPSPHLFASATQALCLQSAIRMKLILRSVLLLLGDLVLAFPKRWNQMTHRLWYILGILRSWFLSRNPERRDKILPSVECRPAKSDPATVICVSRLPPPLTPITDTNGNAPLVTSPTLTTASIEVRGLVIDEVLHQSHENHGADHFDANSYMPVGSNPSSRSPDIARHHDELDPDLSQNREATSGSPATISPNDSRPPSLYPHRPAPLHTERHLGYRPESRCSHHVPPESSCRSPPHLNDADGAARGYLPEPPSPAGPSSAQSTRPPSVSSSISSRIYRATRPVTRVRTASVINTLRRGNISSTSALHETPVPQRPGSTHGDHRRVAVSFDPLVAPQYGRLRPMVEIDRYGEREKVVVADGFNTHLLPPVTTVFAG